MVLGIDVSPFNKNIDFHAVKAAGYLYVYIKASEGVDYAYLQSARKQAEAAREAGLLISYYHFGNPAVNEHTAADEAAKFIDTIQQLPKPDLIPCLDVEPEVEDGGKKYKPVTCDLQVWIKQFIQKLAESGYRMSLYGGPGY